MTSVTVRKVDSKTERNLFVRFPWRLYEGDPYWVPPLVSMQKHKINQAKASAWKYMEGDYFIAWRGDQPVGTISAQINHRHNEFQDEHIGFFGMFDLIDDQEVANALLATASEWVEQRGYDAIRGPASFSTNDLCGALVEGYNQRPAILMPYNYPYYDRLLSQAPGFEKAMDLRCYHFTLGQFEHSKTLEQSLRVTAKNNVRREITVRRMDGKHIKQDMLLLRGIYNRAWEKNWGFVPLTNDELDDLIKELGQYIMPDLTLFAFVKGEPAAFLLAVPDMNQALHPAHPHPDTPEILTLLKALWHWKIRSKITGIRIPLLGVDERFRGIGVEGALFAELHRAFQEIVPTTSWRTADAGWVLETNEAMHRLVLALGGEPYRRYRFYERQFTHNRNVE